MRQALTIEHNFGCSDSMQMQWSRLSIFLSLFAFVMAWIALSFAKADTSVLPQPWQVWDTFIREWRSGEMWLHTAATLVRVSAAFVISMIVGTVLGYWLGRFPKLNEWANTWVVIFLNIPALVIIVLCYLWIGLNETAAITAVCINKTAMVLVMIREGTQTLSKPIDEMSRVFGMSSWRKLRYVVAPQLAPFFFASARNGLAVIWKIVLVVEFLGRNNGIGFQIHLYFQLFDTATVMAYAFSFVAVMLAIEYLLLKPLEAISTKWKS